MRDERPRRPHPSPEFLVEGMRRMGVDEHDIAALEASNPGRIREWMKGTDNVPFRFFWTLPLLVVPGNYAIAMRIARRAVDVGPGYDPWTDVRIIE